MSRRGWFKEPRRHSMAAKLGWLRRRRQRKDIGKQLDKAMKEIDRYVRMAGAMSKRTVVETPSGMKIVFQPMKDKKITHIMEWNPKKKKWESVAHVVVGKLGEKEIIYVED